MTAKLIVLMNAYLYNLQTSTETGLALVTGGTGALGLGLVQHLADAGFAVRVIARHPPPLGIFPQNVELIIGDIGQRECMRKALEGVKFVFHLAARLHLANPATELLPEYRRVNVEGTRCVVNECLVAGVVRLVYFSTISVYGPTLGTCADEGTLPHPDNIYGQTKLEGENLVLAARNLHTGSPLGVILRMAAIYGPRMKGNYPRLLNALSRGMFVPVGRGDNRRTLVYEDDAIRAALLAVQHPKAAGGIYNVSDGAIHSLRDIIETICIVIGRRPPRFYVPARPARWLAQGVDGLTKLAGRPLKLTATIDKFIEDVAVRAELIRQVMGFQPAFGLEKGWREAIAAWRQ